VAAADPLYAHAQPSDAKPSDAQPSGTKPSDAQPASCQPKALHSCLGTRPSPERNTPKRAPPTAPTRYAARANRVNLHLSSTIFRKTSRSATEEENFEYFLNYLCLFCTRMPMLRHQDLL
jgi:hypothetical protein